MLRLIVVSLAASVVALWAVTAKADGLTFATEKPPFTSTVVPQGSVVMPVQHWRSGDRDPAITKTLRPDYAPAAPSYDAPQYEEPSVQHWQHPTYPGSRFSYPQQGYYPREGYQQQHPGYEYDFDQGSGYSSHYPMEGANHRTVTPAWRSMGQTQPIVPIQTSFSGTYVPCPQF